MSPLAVISLSSMFGKYKAKKSIALAWLAFLQSFMPRKPIYLGRGCGKLPLSLCRVLRSVTLSCYTHGGHQVNRSWNKCKTLQCSCHVCVLEVLRVKQTNIYYRKAILLIVSFLERNDNIFRKFENIFTKKVVKMSKSKKPYVRCYWHSLIVYSAPNTFRPLLDKATHWAYAYHDLDVDKEGKPKPPHYHLLLHFKQARSVNSCIKYILSNQNVFGEECVSPLGAYEYLWHKNDIDKYQYDRSIVVTHNPVYWDRFLPDIRDRTNIDFIEDLMSGVDMLTMAKRYGRDYMKNYRSYEDFVDEAKRREQYVLKNEVASPRLPWQYQPSNNSPLKNQEFSDIDFN